MIIVVRFSTNLNVANFACYLRGICLVARKENYKIDLSISSIKDKKNYFVYPFLIPTIPSCSSLFRMYDSRSMLIRVMVFLA